MAIRKQSIKMGRNILMHIGRCIVFVEVKGMTMVQIWLEFTMELKQLFWRKNPQALFSPCSAHSLNLCGVHAVESSAVLKSFFGNIQRLYSLFSSSPSRWKILQEAAGVSLRKLFTTRWSARIEAVRPREILDALKGLKDHDLSGDVCNDVENLTQWLQSLHGQKCETVTLLLNYS